MRVPIGARYGVALVVVLLAGLGAFFLGRYALSEDATTEAQVDPEGTPVIIEGEPHPEVAAMSTAVTEEQSKEPLVGEFNGATFLQAGEPIPPPEEDVPMTGWRATPGMRPN